jgi:ribosome-associated protein
VLRVTDEIAIHEGELEERFLRASGPGGQNINKVSTAVELRFDVRHSSSLPRAIAMRLERLAGRRLTEEGVLVIRAERFRTQERNREDARGRLIELIRQAAITPKRRVPTKPSRAQREHRREAKAKQSRLKSLRRSKPPLEGALKFLLGFRGATCGLGLAPLLSLERGRLGLALLGCLALSLSLATGFNLAGSHTCRFGLGLLVPALTHVPPRTIVTSRQKTDTNLASRYQSSECKIILRGFVSQSVTAAR